MQTNSPNRGVLSPPKDSSQASELRRMERDFEQISPFEFKNKLLRLAAGKDKKSTHILLNAGRGNPNWTAATPRQAFFTLGQFAVTETQRVWSQGDLAGKPRKPGIAQRLRDYLQSNPDLPGQDLLQRIVADSTVVRGLAPDDWVFEWVDGIIGDNYPVPDRMLIHVEQVVHDYLMQEMCDSNPPPGRFDLFAVEGATAAMCYIFDSLTANLLLTSGNKVALMVPIFPPYVEIPQLDRYGFDVVEIRATAVDDMGKHTWQYPPTELDKLKDPAVKALFLVNPSNPPSVSMQAVTIQRLIQIVRENNPNLMIISDDVYGTFVDSYRSLVAELPYNTLGVYSFSKYFGVTGWRLGVILLHETNVLDQLLHQLPAEKRAIVNKRYESLSLHPEKLRFMDRLVADSRQVALNHTAGLSTPQQVQMALFAEFALLDKDNQYKKMTQEVCHRRKRLLFAGLGLQEVESPYDAAYYTEFDLAQWASHHFGEEFSRYLQANYEPVDILFRLAEKFSIVLLNGGGFHGPQWSIRISLANLEDAAYAKIGQAVRETLQEYVAEWSKAKSTHI
ncbi:aspartate 4-decarboxylase [Alicyclobacillaceae bacterium I2511]|nr:aspartate 4-decarboxylase [Alicyclobacillaceae bacterium I2511]